MNRPVWNFGSKKIRRESGLVIDSMFRAIQMADVLIADLTGSNANVFLELGIRFGVSNKVTILTTQEERQAPFDLNQMRVVRDGGTDLIRSAGRDCYDCRQRS